MSQVISKRMVNEMLVKLNKKLVKQTALLLSNSHDADGFISDREMLALSVGMQNAEMRISGKLQIESAEESMAHVMRAYRMALIAARAKGRDIELWGD